MAEYLIQDTTLTAIADAIRAKTNTTNPVTTSDMANMIGSISTGTELNFEIVGGTTQPANPTENMIWVNTDSINNYYFSVTQPENLVDYDVWFTIDISSDVEFNALKENGIQVYPVSAKQYVGGTLVDVSAMSYQNATWIDLGSEIVVVPNIKDFGQSVWKTGVTGNLSISIDVSDTQMKISYTVCDKYVAYVSTPIKLKDQSVLQISSNYSNSGSKITLKLGIFSDSACSTLVTGYERSEAVSDTIYHDYDISALTAGTYYLGFWITCSGSSERTGTCTITNMVLK